MSRKEEAETAAGIRTIRKNQAVLVLTETPGKTWRGIIRSTGKIQSLIRMNKDGQIVEQRVNNKLLMVVKCKPQPQTA